MRSTSGPTGATSRSPISGKGARKAKSRAGGGGLWRLPSSHKAILNLLDACAEAIGTPFRCLKIRSTDNVDEDATFAAANRPIP